MFLTLESTAVPDPKAVTVGRDRKTGRMNGRGFFNEKGVTAMDIVKSRDRSNAGLFSHINFNESDVGKCYNKLLTERSEVSSIITTHERDNGEIAYKIEKEVKEWIPRKRMLEQLIINCTVLLTYVKYRIEEELRLTILRSYNFLSSSSNNSNFSFTKSIKQQERFILQVSDWYRSSFGQKRLNDLYAEMRVRQARYLLENSGKADTFHRLEVKAAAHDQLRYGLSNEDMNNRLYDMMVKEGDAISDTFSNR